MILVIIFLGICLFSFAEKRYVVKLMHNDASAVYDMNNKGEVAFLGRDQDGQVHVFLYSNEAITQLTNNFTYPYTYYSVDINDNGHVVWSMWTTEGGTSYKTMIMLWNGNEVVKVMDDLVYGGYIFPFINNQGTIFWDGAVWGNRSDIHMFIDGAYKNITNQPSRPHSDPRMNSNGWIVWYGNSRDINDWTDRVRLKKPDETGYTEIAAGGWPQIDDNNNIVFLTYVSTTSENYYALNLYHDNEVKNIAHHHVADGQGYRISNGNVVYTLRISDIPSAIHLFDGTETRQISLPDTENKKPRVNIHGMATWMSVNGLSYDIYAFRDNTTVRVGGFADNAPFISDDGSAIVYAGGSLSGSGHPLYLAIYKDVCDINGKVVLQDGTPLPGVDILLKDEKVCSTTNEGTFEITDIDAGEIILTFMNEGYAFEPPSMTINLTGHLSIFPDIVARDVTSVNDIPLANQIKVYPNPAGDFITINCGQIAERTKEIIFTHVNGQVVKRMQSNELGKGIHKEFIISTNDLAPGIYICTLLVGNSKVNKMITVVR